MKIQVAREGRTDMYIPTKESLIEFIQGTDQKEFHCYLGGRMMIGADWEKGSLIEEIEKSDRIAILLGNAKSNNLGHSLAVITENELKVFDVYLDESNLIIN